MSENKTPLEKFQGEVDAKKQYEVEEIISALRNEKDSWKYKHDSIASDFDAFKNDSKWLDVLEKEFTQPIPLKPLERTGTSESVAMAFGGDWHPFERVYPEEVNNLNDYTPEIAKDSIERFFQGIIAWTEVHRSRTQIRQLVLAFLGDLITNMIHMDQVEHNAGTPQEEILFVVGVMVAGIDLLLRKGNFDEIVIVGVDGNHGRDTGKIRVTGRAKHSHEWLIYHFIAMIFKERKEKRIKFVISNGIHHYQPVYDFTFRIHHGDAIRYMGGIGGLTIPMNKAIGEWNKGRHADYDVFGHWHQFINPGNFLANPSVVGYSAYSLWIKAAFESPGQTLLTVDKKRFVTSTNRIFVRS